MDKSILINQYKSLLIDIINEYRKFFKENKGYYNYKEEAFLEIEKIAHAFEVLTHKKIDASKLAFKDNLDSILYAVDSVLFEHMKTIFENVRIILNNN